MRASLKLPLALACAGLLGLALGAWGMRWYFQRTLAAWDPAQRLVAELSQQLDLDQDQRERAALVLAEARGRMEERRQAWRLDVRQLAREGEDQLARLLRPDQQERFSRLHDQIHGRMDEFLWSSPENPTAMAIAPVR
jgi:hypothetical protein